MGKFDEANEYHAPQDEDAEIEDMFAGVETLDTQCSDNQLVIQNNVVSIKGVDTGTDNSYNPGF